ncbi:MAG: phosphoribosylformylglycinamidine cyclo-ligase [Dehalococcoidaceae bacterium]|nr:phosphoribosylformylglycinamidine cyclo-ligase [Dehalococcoidaceae bacterium]
MGVKARQYLNNYGYGKEFNIKESYASAGVDIDAGEKAKKQIAAFASATLGPEVLKGPGFFGGLYELKGYSQPVLVSSADGVGTKLKLATVLNRHEGVGHDIVNHCVNDIFTSGAKPLFFLDYIASGKLDPVQIQGAVKGMADACREVGCALIGGETAEMPGMYSEKDYDLVGFIVGVVEKPDIITGETICPGDVIIGMPSSGLHTNGYSLARRVLGQTPEQLSIYSPELGKTIGEALLEPHRCYYNDLKPHLARIKGMAHITGGGLPGNVVRVLGPETAARFDTSSWQVPDLFKFIQRKGDIGRGEMYRVFNMGIGMTLFCDSKDAGVLLKALPGAVCIGEAVRAESKDRVILD